MKITERRIIAASDIRSLCIRKNWYTLGTSIEHFELPRNALHIQNATAEDLYEIARHIWHCSFTEASGLTIASIMHELLKICNTFFDIKEGESQ